MIYFEYYCTTYEVVPIMYVRYSGIRVTKGDNFSLKGISESIKPINIHKHYVIVVDY